MQYHVVIVAGGSGARMQSEVPKQFMLLQGKPVLAYSLEKFFGFDNNMNIVVVLAEEHIAAWNKLVQQHNITIPHTIAMGGPTRFHSVKSGLQAIKSADGIVGIHDGARPLISPQLIAECYQFAERYGNAIPAVAPAETVRLVDGGLNKQLDRTQLRLIQTPQCFKLDELKRAYGQPYNELFTDDASVLEANGGRIHLIEGERANLKITTQPDLLFAEAMLGA